MSTILPLAYLPSVEYFTHLLRGGCVVDLGEHFVKRSERNRARILASDGVMGCIVNGPGEMADADYGYVGAGPGRITLYKGRTVVERNIPQEEALDRLVELIKKNGDWTPA